MFKKFILFNLCLLAIIGIYNIANPYFLSTPSRNYISIASKPVELVTAHNGYLYLVRPNSNEDLNSYTIQKRNLDNNIIKSITIKCFKTFLYLHKIKVIDNAIFISGISIDTTCTPEKYYPVRIYMGIDLNHIFYTENSKYISSKYIKKITTNIDDCGGMYIIFNIYFNEINITKIYKYDSNFMLWGKGIPGCEYHDSYCEGEFLYLTGSAERDENLHYKNFISKINKDGVIVNLVKTPTDYINFKSYITVADEKPVIAMVTNANWCGSGIIVKIKILDSDLNGKYIYTFTRDLVCTTYNIELLRFEDDIYVIPVFESYTLSGKSDKIWIEIYALSAIENYYIKQTSILPKLNVQQGEWIDYIAACIYSRSNVKLSGLNNTITQKRLIIYQSENDMKLKIYDFWIPKKIETTINFDFIELRSLPARDYTQTPYGFNNAKVVHYDHGILKELDHDEIIFPLEAYYVDYFDFFINDFFVKGQEILSQSYGANNKTPSGIGIGTYPGWVKDGNGNFVLLIGYDNKHGGYFLLDGGPTIPSYGYIAPPNNSGYYFEVDQIEDIQ